MTNRQVGWILFDSASAAVEDGLRGGPLRDRALVFQFDSFTVDLIMLREVEGQGCLHGQVMQRNAMAPLSGASVRVEDEVVRGETDENGHFALDLVQPEKTHILQIESGDMEMICRIPATAEAGLP